MKNSELKSVEKSGRASTRNQKNSPQRILVVDDEADARQICIEILTGSGYVVESANDGVAGWEALQSNRYDLVITDNKMPRMSGMEMIEKLRVARMGIPVIMATGFMPTHIFDRHPSLKPDATLERPFSNDELLAAVKKILLAQDGDEGRPESLLPKYL